jgi:hypothetical protein
MLTPPAAACCCWHPVTALDTHTEFIQLLSSESNELATKDHKSTITPGGWQKGQGEEGAAHHK